MTSEDDNPAIHGSESIDDDRTTPELADQGKAVVDPHGEPVGMVSDVEGNTLYVDPDPSLTERVMSSLHWREGGRDELEISTERIRRIDDEVVLELDDEPASQSR